MNRFLQISAAVVFSTMLLPSCSQDPIEEIGYVSNERAIESFSVAGQVGEAEITRTVDQAEVVVTVLETVDLTCVTPEIMVSLGATVEPASGEPVNFADNGNTMKYTVTSEAVAAVRIRRQSCPELYRDRRAGCKLSRDKSSRQTYRPFGH